MQLSTEITSTIESFWFAHYFIYLLQIHWLANISYSQQQLEKVLYIMSNLPGGPVSKFVQDKVISLLWYDLPHPPATYIADEYRHPDGSGNNPHFPNLGKAGSSYSRNVQSTTAMPDIEQPDPALVFDSLLRREAFVEHPAGNSSLMFGSVSSQLL